MSESKHYRRLESMYQAAPVNAFYSPTMTVEEGKAEISIELSEKYHHYLSSKRQVHSWV